MGVFETLLLLVGSAVAIAIIGFIAYRGFGVKKSVSDTILENSSVGRSEPSTVPAQVATSTNNLPGSAASVESVVVLSTSSKIVSTLNPNTSTANAIEEAPPPFPEELSTTHTSIPTDVNAVTSIVGPDGSAAPVLVISAPKLRSRKTTVRKRLYPTSTIGTTATPRRRRTTTTSRKMSTQVTVRGQASGPAGFRTERKQLDL